MATSYNNQSQKISKALSDTKQFCTTLLQDFSEDTGEGILPRTTTQKKSPTQPNNRKYVIRSMLDEIKSKAITLSNKRASSAFTKGSIDAQLRATKNTKKSSFEGQLQQVLNRRPAMIGPSEEVNENTWEEHNPPPPIVVVQKNKQPYNLEDEFTNVGGGGYRKLSKTQRKTHKYSQNKNKNKNKKNKKHNSNSKSKKTRKH